MKVMLHHVNQTKSNDVKVKMVTVIRDAGVEVNLDMDLLADTCVIGADFIVMDIFYT